MHLSDKPLLPETPIPQFAKLSIHREWGTLHRQVSPGYDTLFLGNHIYLQKIKIACTAARPMIYEDTGWESPGGVGREVGGQG